MKKYKIVNDDVLHWADHYKGKKFHALLTDSPYNLDTIRKRFGKDGSKPPKGGVYQRSVRGFMSSDWDTDIAMQPETWAALGEHLYPGAFGMTFGGSRTAHRIAVAIEDAGFIIHPMIGWCYGSGFPKATRVKGHKEFDGHRYGMQALKPAMEPIIVFQKPYENKPVQDITKYGSGALNIDAGRIPTTDEYVINRFDDGMKPFGHGAGHKYKSVHVPQSNPKNRRGVVGSDFGFNGSSLEKYQDAQRKSIEQMESLGRWPANFIIDDNVAHVLDAQSGHLKSGKFTKDTVINSDWGYTGGKRSPLPLSNTIGDEGGASRFFYNVQTRLDATDPFIYQKKPSGKERDAGLNGKNPHPTVKSLDLNRYLASLLLPPNGYAPRRLLAPFSGVSSEMIGGLLAGWEYVEGIELGKEYCVIGEKRIKYWLRKN